MSYYEKRTAEATARLKAELAKPTTANEPVGGKDYISDDDEFNPWSLFPAVYGSYSGAFDRVAVTVLQHIVDRDYSEEGTAEEMFREMLCTAGFCTYGGSPRGCFPENEEIRGLFAELLRRWKEDYVPRQWGVSYDEMTGGKG